MKKSLYLQIAIVSILGLFITFVFYDLVLDTQSMSGCGTIIVGAFVVPVVIVLLLVRWIIWGLRKAGIISAPKEELCVPERAELLSILKAQGGPVIAALLQYTDDAMREEQAKPQIAAALHEKGWPEGEIAKAFECYDSLSKDPIKIAQAAGTGTKTRNERLPVFLSALTVIEVLLVLFLASGWPTKFVKARRAQAQLLAQARHDQEQAKHSAAGNASESNDRGGSRYGVPPVPRGVPEPRNSPSGISASGLNEKRGKAEKEPENPAKNKTKTADSGALEDCGDGKCSWEGAREYCKGKGGLPTIAGLKKMYTTECTGGVTYNTCDKWYWSSEVESAASDSVWYMHFRLGTVMNASKTNDFYVRCAR